MKNMPLFEVRPIRDLKDMLEQSVAEYGDKTAFLIKDSRIIERDRQPATPVKGTEQPYLPVSYSRYAEDVASFGTYLKGLDHDVVRVAILAETRYEWYVTYLATVNGAAIVVPLDRELPESEIISLLDRSKADVLVFSKSKQNVIDAVKKQAKTVSTLISMDEPDPEQSILSFWDCLAEGENKVAAGERSFLDAPIDPEAMNVLLFTSGTTARSKAVMLSHKNLCVNLMAMCQMTYIDDQDIFLSVLPLHHTYECTCGFLCPIYRGSTVATCEGLRHIARNMQESKVTIILVVPLMAELFYKRIRKTVTADPKLAKKFQFGLKLSNALRKVGIDIRRKLFAQVHETFGGHLRMMIAGGAAIDPAILKGMRDLGILSIQGYGLTECAPILALNRNVFYNDKAAGLPLPGVEVKIIDQDENGIGEIIGRGDNVMLGYYEDEEQTRAAIDEEGFFHTGDLGFLDKDGFVIITGRKKNVIVTKNGKNIFPEEIEFLLSQSEWVAESLVSGQKTESNDMIVIAEIFANEEKVKAELGDVGLSSDAVRERIAEEVKNVNHQLTSYKAIRKFSLRDEEFEKTTSRKIKRQY